jgi:fructose-1,6-bisphosphatase
MRNAKSAMSKESDIPHSALRIPRPLIIHIQDAHTSLEAQRNIAQIIEHLQKNYGVTSIALEGGRAGTLDISMFRRHPDRLVRELISDYYLRQGKLTGAEQAAIVSDSKLQLFGAEDEKLYQENLASFLAITQDRQALLEQLNVTLEGLEKELQHHSSSDLRSFISMVYSYEKNKIQFSTFLQELLKRAQPLGLDILDYPNIMLMLEAVGADPRVRPNSDSTRHNGPTHGSVPTNVLNRIDPFLMVEEAQRLEGVVAERLSQTTQEREQLKLRSQLLLLKSILSLKAFPREVEQFRKQYVGAQFIAPIGLDIHAAGAINRTPTLISSALSFYALAEKRNHTLIDNVLSQAQKRSDPSAPIVIVAGGYHTPGLTELLREKGYPYVVIAPQVTSSDETLPYLDQMLGKKSDYEKMLESSYSTLAHAVLSGLEGPAKQALIHCVAIDTRTVDLSEALAIEGSGGVRQRVRDFNPTRKEAAERALRQLATFADRMEIVVDDQNRLVVITQEHGREVCRTLDGKRFEGGSFQLPRARKQTVDLNALLAQLETVWTMSAEEAQAFRAAYEPHASSGQTRDEGIETGSPTSDGVAGDLIPTAAGTEGPNGPGVPVTPGGGSGGFEEDGFSPDFSAIVSKACEVSPNIRNIWQQRGIQINREDRAVYLLAQKLSESPLVSQVREFGAPQPLFQRGTPGYQAVIFQESFQLIKGSQLSIGTLVALYDQTGTLVGAASFLNGPVTTLVMADGAHFAHFAYDGKEFQKREKIIQLSGSTAKESTTTLGARTTDWPSVFRRYYTGNKRSIPGFGTVMGDDGKPKKAPSLKTRYSGYGGESGQAANMYEILVNNGFLAELMTPEEARIWGLVAKSAGGDAVVMTNQGLRELDQIPGEESVVQLYTGNQGVVGQVREALREATETKEELILPAEESAVQLYTGNQGVVGQVREALKEVTEIKEKLTLPARAPPKSTSRQEVRAATDISLNRFIGSLLTESGSLDPADSDLIKSLQEIEKAASQVPSLYVSGGEDTDEIDSGGSKVKKIDKITDVRFSRDLKPHIAAYLSEEFTNNYTDGNGKHLAYFGDPLDGSSKVECNGGGGTIGAFFDVKPGEPLTGKDVTARNKMRAAFFITYGDQTKMVLALRNRGVFEFELNPDDNRFYFSRKIDFSKVETREDSPMRIAIGGSRSNWPAGLPEWVDQKRAAGAEDGYNGAMVTDVYGLMNWILEGGRGAFAYMENKLRVKYEESPMAFIFEQAGGASLTCDLEKQETGNPLAREIKSALDRAFKEEPNTEKQQKAPVAIGDRATIEEIRSAISRGQGSRLSVTVPVLRGRP